MSQDPAGPSKVRFDDFELDLSNGELRKRGIRRKLAPQPLEVLALLLESPGKVVSREKLQQRLWPDDTFVQFDLSLNAAVRKLRRALGDSSQAPRFVETVPKRGYRFIAPVEIDSETTPPALETRPRRRSLLRIAPALAALAVVAGAIVFEDRFADPIEAGPYRFSIRALDVLERPRDPALSPDGRSIAYVARADGNAEIYIQPLTGGNVTRLTDDPAPDLNPAWSPDGARIAFQRRWPATGPGTYVASLHDGSQTLVMGQTQGASSWTPDGAALIASQDGARLHRVDLRTRTVEPLFEESPDGFQEHAAVSPDGESVAYARCLNPNSCDIYVAPLPSGPEKRLTFHYGNAAGIAWTPDGNELIYSMDGRLYRVPATGRVQPARLEFEPAELVAIGALQSPTVARSAPAGRTPLAFRYLRLDVDIWITDLTADPNGPLRRRKLIDSDGADEWPSFSPDGAHIAFTSNRDGERAIWISNRAGDDIRRLTPPGFLVKPGWLAWSPDGSMIAFSGATPEEGVHHIYRLALGGGPPRRVTFGTGESGPLWSRDGLWIYHQTREGPRPSLWKSPADGSGPPVEVRSVPAWCYDESSDGRYLYFCGSGDSPTPYGALFRMPAAGGAAERVAGPFSFARIQFQNGGLYHIRRQRTDGERRSVLARFDLETGQIEEVGPIANPWGPTTFSLSQRGNRLLTMHMESMTGAILLAGKFQ